MTSATRVSADSPAAVARTVMSRSVIMPTRPVLSQTGRAPTLSSSITCAARRRLSSGRTTCTLRVMKSEIFCMGGLAKRDVDDRTFDDGLANRAPVCARPLQGLVTSCAARRERPQQCEQPPFRDRQRAAARLAGRERPALLEQAGPRL